MLGRALSLLLCFSFCSRALADDAWRAPAGCPDRAHAEDRLRALHADPALLRHGNAAVSFDVSATGEQRARVRLRHGERVEQRVLYDRSCEALAEAALLVISLAFEDEPAEPQAQLHTPSTALSLAPLARLDVGSLPSPTYGVGGALRLHVGRLAGELEGSYFGERSNERGAFGLVSGAVRSCYTLTGRWLAGCAALELGQARGRGVGLNRVNEARGLWAAALIGLAVSLPTRYVSPSVDLELGLPFQRPSFDVEMVGPVFLARGVILRASLRIAFELM